MSAAEAVTSLLGGRVRLVAHGGLPPTTDTVMLAAATPVGPGARVLEAGCGSGAASLCLAARVGDCTVIAVERDAGLAQAARTNSEANAMAGRIAVLAADIAAPPEPWPAPGFDAVMSNPPYLDPARSRGSPDPLRHAATVESLPLPAWLGACAAALRPGGDLVVIHRADRLADLLAGMPASMGSIAILPLWPGGQGAGAARRILVRATRGGRAPLALLPGLVLHGLDGRYTGEAEAVLRDGTALPWTGRG